MSVLVNFDYSALILTMTLTFNEGQSTQQLVLSCYIISTANFNNILILLNIIKKGISYIDPQNEKTAAILNAILDCHWLQYDNIFMSYELKDILLYQLCKKISFVIIVLEL